LERFIEEEEEDEDEEDTLQGRKPCMFLGTADGRR